VTCKRCSVSIDVGQLSVRWRSPDGLRSLYHHPACLGIPAAVKIVNSNYSIGVDCDLTTEQVQRIKQDILAASEAGGGGRRPPPRSQPLTPAAATSTRVVMTTCLAATTPAPPRPRRAPAAPAPPSTTASA
jgi:hypothetical protein